MASYWSLLKGDFLRHAATLALGTGLSQLIPLLVSPILTRIYSPAEYGGYAIYVALLAFLSVIATGKYDLAVVLPQENRDADSLVFLSVAAAVGIGLLTLAVVLVFHDPIVFLLGSNELSGWLYFLPFSVVMAGSYQATNYWLNRDEQYRAMSANRVLQSALLAGTQLFLGLTRWTNGGLILGQIFAQAFVSLQLLFRFSSSTYWRGRVTSDCFQNARRLATEYRHHPISLMPAFLADSFALQLPILTISALFGSASAGVFMLAQRVTMLPVTLVASAIGDVYRQQAAKKYRENGSFTELYLKLLVFLAGAALVPFGVTAAVAPDLFHLVFGEGWRDAGVYAQLIVISAYFQFVFTPMDKGAVIVGATRYIEIIEYSRLIAAVLASSICWYADLDLYVYIVAIVVADSAFYLVEGMMGYVFSRGQAC